MKIKINVLVKILTKVWSKQIENFKTAKGLKLTAEIEGTFGTVKRYQFLINQHHSMVLSLNEIRCIKARYKEAYKLYQHNFLVSSQATKKIYHHYN